MALVFENPRAHAGTFTGILFLARVRLDGGGVVTVETDITDIGTESYTVIAQTAAETMGVGLDRVVVKLGDSDFPASAGSGGQWGGSLSGVAPSVALRGLRISECLAHLENLPITVALRVVARRRTERRQIAHRAGVLPSGDQPTSSWHTSRTQQQESPSSARGVIREQEQVVVQQRVNQQQTGWTRAVSPPVRRGVPVLLCAVGLTVAGCKGRRSDTSLTPGWSPESGDVVMKVPPSAVVTAIEAQLASGRPPAIPVDRWKHVRRVYTEYGNVPLWLEKDGFHQARSKALLRAVLDANTDALRLDAYPLDDLVAAVGIVRDSKTLTADQLATADVLLTSAYVGLAEDLLTGQVNPKALAQDWHIAVNREPIDSAVARSLRDAHLDSAIARMRPRDADYDALRRALVHFRGIVTAGGWSTVAEGKALKPGQADTPVRMAALRGRLRVEGFGAQTGATASSGPGIYDAGLAGLVAEFQARHGIVVDSMLGAKTVKALNVPAQYRLAQIAANLERYRWMPRSLGERYIIVNVPAFRLEAHDSTGTLEMKVIVGQEFEGRKTPVFADVMETVVFRPYWNITPDIQKQEIAPKIADDQNYMAANDLEYFEDGGETRIRQKPGSQNSLGLVKFLFPNSFNIYLHDTPEDELFDKDVRAFSHGCIRLEKPAELAQWVLGWDGGRINAAMQSGKDNQSEKLPRKIPVYIVYATAYERDGQLYFGNDLYGRDDALVSAMSQSLAPTAEALRSLNALRKMVDD